jgi:hypothetical protein
MWQHLLIHLLLRGSAIKKAAEYDWLMTNNHMNL